MGKWRTNPSFLSDEEVARDRIRTEEVVRSIAGNKQVNRYISHGKEIKPAWYANRLCDSCGNILEMSSYRCKKCNIALCYTCGKEISKIKRKSYLCCPMCDRKLE